MSGNAAALGARPPNVRERAQGMGVGPYLNRMGIGEYQTAQALGDIFNPDALAACIGRPLARWLAGGPPEEIPAPNISELVGCFEGLRRQVVDEGFFCQDCPPSRGPPGGGPGC